MDTNSIVGIVFLAFVVIILVLILRAWYKGNSSRYRYSSEKRQSSRTESADSADSVMIDTYQGTPQHQQTQQHHTTPQQHHYQPPPIHHQPPPPPPPPSSPPMTHH